MHSLKRNAIVPYSAQEMYDLVDGIDKYADFLPWCNKTTIVSRDEQEVVAELEIAWKGIHKSFSTRNKLYPHHKMDIELVNGPMRHLEGIWEFQSLGEKACKINLELDFEFSGSFMDRLFEPVFSYIANSLVDAFIQRAHEVYGDRETTNQG